MAAIMVDTKTVHTLNANSSLVSHWNHAAPAHAVYFANAIPELSSGPQDVRVEVTRLWRRMSHTQTTEGQLVTGENVEHEIWYEVHNPNPNAVNFVIHFGVVY